MSEATTLKFNAISEEDRMLIRSIEAMATTLSICKLLSAHLADCPPPPGRTTDWNEAVAGQLAAGIQKEADDTWATGRSRIMEIIGGFATPPYSKQDLEESTYDYEPDEIAALREMLPPDEVQVVLDKLHRHPSYPLLCRAYGRYWEVREEGFCDEAGETEKAYEEILVELYNTRFRRTHSIAKYSTHY